MLGAYNSNPNATTQDVLIAGGVGALVGGVSATVPIGGGLAASVVRNTAAGAGGNAVGQEISGGAIDPSQVAVQGLVGGVTGGTGNVVGLFQSLNYVRAGFTAAEAVALGADGGTAAAVAAGALINSQIPSLFGGYGVNPIAAPQSSTSPFTSMVAGSLANSLLSKK
jgi:hypothetical protein